MATASSHPRLITRDGWRFSLRTLLVLLFIAAIPLAWVSHWRSKRLREHAAAKRLRELGLMVKERRPDRSPGSKSAEPWYAVLLPPEHTNLVVWVGAPPDLRLDADAVLLLSDLPNLRRLDLLGQIDLPEASLTPLQSLPQLEILRVQSSAKVLPHFSNQRMLSELHLGDIRVTDDCAKLLQNNPRLTAVALFFMENGDRLTPDLARLENLEFLELIETGISSAGISDLRSLSKLHQLLLDGKEIDDAAVPTIAQLNTLRYLSVRGTRISDTGIEKLRAALPNCKFE